MVYLPTFTKYTVPYMDPIGMIILKISGMYRSSINISPEEHCDLSCRAVPFAHCVRNQRGHTTCIGTNSMA